MINWTSVSLQDLAVYIEETLRKHDIDAVLVGGACVTIYSKNRYQSYDLDFVTYESMKEIKKAMTILGYTQKGKHFERPDCPWLVDFVPPPIAIGEQPVIQFTDLQLPLGRLRLLRAEDCVKDRLASFFHWSDRQSLEQAVLVIQSQSVDMNEIESWVKAEGFKDRWKEVERVVKEI